jgi:hypothetical protein
MPLTRYYLQGSDSTIADRATSEEGIDGVIVEMTFPNEEAQKWFEEGLNFADGWLEVNGYDTEEEAKQAVRDAVGDETFDHDSPLGTDLPPDYDDGVELPEP